MGLRVVRNACLLRVTGCRPAPGLVRSIENGNRAENE